MNLLDEVDKIKKDGYSEANAEAKLCQDIIIKAIAQSSLNRNVTIKGGVVMRSRSKNARRATQDLDMEKLRFCIQKYIYADTTIDVNDADEIRKRAERIVNSSTYKKQVERSKKNWLDLSVDEVLKKDLEFLSRI